MALELRANTAVDVLIGPFVDNSDGDTAETGLTISQADVLLSKNGQALTQKNDVTACSHDSGGCYNCELDATDTNTEGQLVLFVHESGALYVRHEFNVLSEAAWDSKYVAKDDGFMDVNIKTIGRSDTQETEADNLESACSNYSATRGLSGTALPAAVADAAGGLPISDTGGLDLDAVLSGNTPQTGDSFARLGAPAGASIAADLVAIDNFVDDLESRLTAARAGYLDELGAANIPADIDTLLTRLSAARAGYIDNINGHTAQTGDSFARLGAPAGASIAADLVAIDNFVDDLESRLSAARAGYLDELAAANIPADIDTLKTGGWAVEGAITHLHVLRGLLAAIAGISTGGGTANLAFRSQGDTKDRIAVTVDANGNRSAATLDGT